MTNLLVVLFPRPKVPAWALALFLGLTAWTAWAQPPTFERFSPGEQRPGEWAEWQGAHLDDVKKVLMGSTECRFTVTGTFRVLRFQIPLDAAPGPRLLAVYYPSAPGLDAPLKALVAEKPFLVLRPPIAPRSHPAVLLPPPRPTVPVIRSLTPFLPCRSLQEVVVNGEHLGSVRAIRLGILPCDILPGRTGTRISFRVPAQAPAGPSNPRNRITLIYATGLPEPATQILETSRILIIKPPQVRELGPLSGPPGTEATLAGEGLLNIRSVRFGPVDAAFKTVDDTTLLVKIPTAPLTERFTLTGANGAMARSRLSFHVTGLVRLPPVLHDFRPPTGRAGDRIEIAGARLQAVLKVWVGGKTSPELLLHGDTRLTFTVPAGAEPDLPIALEYALEAPGSLDRVESKVPFRVIPPPPVITRVNPVEGPPGTPVVLTGAHFDRLVSVHFGKTRAPAILRSSPTELWVAAPAGAGEGPITVETLSGEIPSPVSFKPEATPAPLSVAFAALYVTQAVQRRDGSVPLVAGKDGVLRIFLQANRGNDYRPAIRVTLLNTGEEPREWYLPAPGPGVPTGIDEDRLSASWNLPLPGSLIKPGATLLAETAAGPTGSPEEKAILSFPATGSPQHLDVRVVPPFRITFVPLRMETTPGKPVGDVSTADLPDLLAFLRAIYPVSKIDARVAPEWPTQVKGGSLDSCARILDALDARRRGAPEPDNARYYFGVFKRPEVAVLHGLAAWGQGAPGGTGIGDDERDVSAENSFASTLAHELGHALGREHAPDPLVPPDTVDRAYPYENGSIGASGFDVARMLPRSPSIFRDVMGYTHPQWISDHTYEAMLAYLTRAPEPETKASAPRIIQ